MTDVKKLEEIVKHGIKFDVEPADSINLYSEVQRRIYKKNKEHHITNPVLDAYCLELSKKYISINHERRKRNDVY